jgi:hypothetical protein
VRLVVRLLILSGAVAAFAVHATAYQSWLIDDSGISIAYATNLAHGHGLVSQPGVPPVEGYSDPLWVFLLAALARAGALSLPLAPKLAGVVLIAGTYAVLLALLERVAARALLAGAFTLLACSMNPSVVIWSTSGLENALYAFCVVGLAYATSRAVAGADAWPFVGGGILAALAAMTRPEGLAFAPLLPSACWIAGRASPARVRRYTAAFATPFGIFLVARYATFHSLLPNTAVAKAHANEVLDALLLTSQGLEKLDRVLEGAFGDLVGNAVFAATLLGLRYLARRGHLGADLGVLVGFASAALVVYMLMPSDWMAENRFATAFFPLYYATVFTVLDRCVESALAGGRAHRAPQAVAALGVALLCASAPDDAGRALVFAQNSNIDLWFVRRAFVERFDRYASWLGVASPSILLPDVGAMLLWSHARVYDLAGLCDAALARLRRHDLAGARDYVLAEIRPTFIHTYGKWSLDLEQDVRFERDYVAIYEYDRDEDPESNGHASGLFVRRDAVATSGGQRALEDMRGEPFRRNGFRVAAPPSFFLRWLETTPLVPEGYHALSKRSGAPPTVAQ